MYLDYTVEIPESKGKITYREKNGATYVYYEYDRVYDAKKKYTTVKRRTIGKVVEDDPTRMRPNEIFKKFFPEVEAPEQREDATRSSCLRSGTFMAIREVVKEYGLDKKLDEVFDPKQRGLILDFAAYSIITEGNAAQYYPDYAYNHPLFTDNMRQYSDSTISDFFRDLTEDQRARFLELWNEERSKRDKIYISYDSTNKNSEAGDIDIVEYGKAKVDTGEPIFNYAVGYDVNNREPLVYEQYPGSINDVSQLKYMVTKVKSYGYRDIGFILDRGYFSHDNLKCLDENGYDFIIMVKGIKDVVHDIIKKHKGTFESDWGSYVSEFGVYGKTVQSFVYASDSKKRYFHLFYNSGKAAGERSRFEETIQGMQAWLDKQRDQEREFSSTFHHYFYIHYDENTFVYAEPKLDVIREELEMCGYFAIISSEKMDFKKAIDLYKSRDASEKVFRADKSYLGNNTLRVASSEAAANKIFVAFIALIIRCRLYTALKDKAKEMTKKPNYLTVPAAIRELEKIEMTRQLDGEYRLDHAVTKTQTEILSAFNIEASHVKYKVAYINDALKGA